MLEVDPRVLAEAHLLLAELEIAEQDLTIDDEYDPELDADATDGETALDYGDTESDPNNLAGIAYALSAGMPATRWKHARKNPKMATLMAKARRQFEQASAAAFALYAAGRIDSTELGARLGAAFTKSAHNAYIAGKRAMGDYTSISSDDEAALQAILTLDQAPLNDYASGANANHMGPVGLVNKAYNDYSNAQMARDTADKLLGRETEADAKSLVKDLALAGAAATGVSASVPLVANADFTNQQYAKWQQVQSLLANSGAQVESYGSMGEMDAMGNLPGETVLVSWQLEDKAKACDDCIALSDASPLYLSALDDQGIYPGSGSTVCGPNCRCHLEYDVPDQVCGDNAPGTDVQYDPSQLIESSAFPGKFNVWVQEADTCANPIDTSNFTPDGADPNAITDDQAFNWDEDVTSQMEVQPLDDAIPMDAITSDAPPDPSIAAQIGSSIADLRSLSNHLASFFDWTSDVVPAAEQASMRVSELSNDVSRYHYVWHATADRIVFDAGAVTYGPPALQTEFTMKSLSELAAKAKADGKALVINGQAASPGMKSWLDTLGAQKTLYGAHPPTVVPHFPSIYSPVDPLAPITGRVFTTDQDAVKWGESIWKPDPLYSAPQHPTAAALGLTDTQKQVLDQYSGGHYGYINATLRGDPTAPQQVADWQMVPKLTSADVEAKVHTLDTVVNKQVLPEAVETTRGIDASAIGGMDPTRAVGKTFTDPGFMSTSVGAPSYDQMVSGEVKDLYLNLTVPAGTPAYFLRNASAFQEENELLLGRGLSYHIDALRTEVVDGTTKTILDAHVVSEPIAFDQSISIGISRMRPEIGNADTYNGVLVARANETIAKAEATTTFDLENQMNVDVTDQKQAMGIYESHGEPTLEVHLNPNDTSVEDLDLASAYLVRRNMQDSSVTAITGDAIARMGLTPNGQLWRMTGLDVKRIGEVYSKVAEDFPAATILDHEGVIEVRGFNGMLAASDQRKFAQVAQEYGAQIEAHPAAIRWTFHDAAARADASWLTGPADSITNADAVIVKYGTDPRAALIPANRSLGVLPGGGASDAITPVADHGVSATEQARLTDLFGPLPADMTAKVSGEVPIAVENLSAAMADDYKAWGSELSPWESNALKKYILADEYGEPGSRVFALDINNYLRGEIVPSDPKVVATYESLKGQLDSAIAKGHIEGDTLVHGPGPHMDQPIAVWRGTSLFGEMPKVGDIVADPAYLSTTVDPRVAARFALKPANVGTPIMYRIALPDGTPAAYLNSIPGAPALTANEREVLLPRDMKLQVAAIHENVEIKALPTATSTDYTKMTPEGGPTIIHHVSASGTVTVIDLMPPVADAPKVLASDATPLEQLKALFTPLDGHIVAPSDQEIAATAKAITRAAKVLIPEPISEGIDIPTGTLKTVKSLGGSTGAKLVQDDYGVQYVDKFGANADHVREEFTADRAYEAMGYPVTRSALIDTPNGPMKRAVYIEGTPLAAWIKTASPADRAIVIGKLQQGLAFDALMANWDVIGLEGDNILVKDLTPFRIDNGGSLRFRAQGGPKGALFGPDVSELTRLRDTSKGAWSGRVFGTTSDAEVRRQVLMLDAHRAEILSTLPDEVKPTVNARLDDMLAKTKDWKVAPTEAGQLPMPGAIGMALPSIPPEEAAAITSWQSGNVLIKDYLRGEASDAQVGIYNAGAAALAKPSLEDTIKGLDSAIDRSTLDTGQLTFNGHPVQMVYRGIQTDGTTIPHVGDVITDKSYVSTSISPKVAAEFATAGPDASQSIIYRMALPEGQKALWLGANGEHAAEVELLLPRGQAFRVINRTDNVDIAAWGGKKATIIDVAPESVVEASVKVSPIRVAGEEPAIEAPHLGPPKPNAETGVTLDGKMLIVPQSIVDQPVYQTAFLKGLKPPYSNIPDPNTLTLVVPKVKLGGLTQKALYDDPAGNTWLFKPKKIFQADEQLSRGAAEVESTADVIARQIGVNVKPVIPYTVAFPGKDGLTITGGNLQQIVKDVKPITDLGATPAAVLDGLSAMQLNELQQGQIFDWLVGNDDGHIGQWMIQNDGHILGIDKDAAIWELPGQYILGHNTMDDGLGFARAIFNADPSAARLAKLDPKAIGALLDRVDAIPDDKYVKMIAPLVPTLMAHPNAVKLSESQWIGYILQRKTNLRHDVETYFTDHLSALPKDVTVPPAWADYLSKGGHFPSKAAATDMSKPIVLQPVGEPKPYLKAEWKVGDPNQYIIPGSPIPLNAPMPGWSGFKPSAPPFLNAKPAPAEMAQLKADANAVFDQHSVAKVIDGTIPIAISQTPQESVDAEKAGLAYAKIGGVRFYAKEQTDLLPMVQYLSEQGHKADDGEALALLGFSQDDQVKLQQYAVAKAGLSARAGVVVVEPDGRMWVLAPNNKFGGYVNTWTKGGIDGDESAASAAVREMREETGISVELDSFLGDYANKEHTSISRMFIGHRTGGGPLYAHPKETYKIKLMTPQEAAKALVRTDGKPDPRDQLILSDAVKAIKGVTGTADYTIPAEDVGQFKAKITSTLDVKVPDTTGKPVPDPGHFAVVPIKWLDDPKAPVAYGFDAGAVNKMFNTDTVTQAADGTTRSTWTLPSGKTAETRYVIGNRAINWLPSQVLVTDPMQRLNVATAQLRAFAERYNSDLTLIGPLKINNLVLANVPALRDLLTANGAVVGNLVTTLDRTHVLNLIPQLRGASKARDIPMVVADVLNPRAKALVKGVELDRVAAAINDSTVATGTVDASPYFNQAEWAAKPMAQQKADWMAMDQQTRDQMADPVHSVQSAIDESMAMIEGRNTAIVDPQLAIAERIAQVKEAGVVTDQAADQISHQMTITLAALKEVGATPEASIDLISRLTDATVAEEIESQGRSLGDHGINHIEGNTKMALAALKVIPGADTPQNRLFELIAAPLHDTGYLTQPGQLFITSEHERWGAAYFNSWYRDDVARILGPEQADHLTDVIATHATSTLDWANDPEGSSFRLADNLALFHDEKLPAFVRYVPENRQILIDWAEGNLLPDAAKAVMKANIAAHLELPQIVRASLLDAIGEASDSLPKWTLGMLGGKVGGISWEGDHIAVDLIRGPSNDALAKVVDLGSEQFAKFAKSYNLPGDAFVSDQKFAFTEDGRVVLTAKITSPAGMNLSPALVDESVAEATPELTADLARPTPAFYASAPDIGKSPFTGTGSELTYHPPGMEPVHNWWYQVGNEPIVQLGVATGGYDTKTLIETTAGTIAKMANVPVMVKGVEATTLRIQTYDADVLTWVKTVFGHITAESSGFVDIPMADARAFADQVHLEMVAKGIEPVGIFAKADDVAAAEVAPEVKAAVGTVGDLTGAARADPAYLASIQEEVVQTTISGKEAALLNAPDLAVRLDWLHTDTNNVAWNDVKFVAQLGTVTPAMKGAGLLRSLGYFGEYAQFNDVATLEIGPKVVSQMPTSLRNLLETKYGALITGAGTPDASYALTGSNLGGLLSDLRKEADWTEAVTPSDAGLLRDIGLTKMPDATEVVATGMPDVWQAGDVRLQLRQKVLQIGPAFPATDAERLAGLRGAAGMPMDVKYFAIEAKGAYREALVAAGGKDLAGLVVFDRVSLDKMLADAAATVARPAADLTPLSTQATKTVKAFESGVDSKLTGLIPGTALTVTKYTDASVTWRRWGDRFEVWDTTGMGSNAALQANFVRLADAMNDNAGLHYLRYVSAPNPAGGVAIISGNITGSFKDLLTANGAKEYPGGVKIMRDDVLALSDKIKEIGPLAAEPEPVTAAVKVLTEKYDLGTTIPETASTLPDKYKFVWHTYTAGPTEQYDVVDRTSKTELWWRRSGTTPGSMVASSTGQKAAQMTYLMGAGVRFEQNPLWERLRITNLQQMDKNLLQMLKDHGGQIVDGGKYHGETLLLERQKVLDLTDALKDEMGVPVVVASKAIPEATETFTNAAKLDPKWPVGGGLMSFSGATGIPMGAELTYSKAPTAFAAYDWMSDKPIVWYSTSTIEGTTPELRNAVELSALANLTGQVSASNEVTDLRIAEQAISSNLRLTLLNAGAVYDGGRIVIGSDLAKTIHAALEANLPIPVAAKVTTIADGKLTAQMGLDVGKIGMIQSKLEVLGTGMWQATVETGDFLASSAQLTKTGTDALLLSGLTTSGYTRPYTLFGALNTASNLMGNITEFPTGALLRIDPKVFTTLGDQAQMDKIEQAMKASGMKMTLGGPQVGMYSINQSHLDDFLSHVWDDKAVPTPLLGSAATAAPQVILPDIADLFGLPKTEAANFIDAGYVTKINSLNDNASYLAGAAHSVTYVDQLDRVWGSLTFTTPAVTDFQRKAIRIAELKRVAEMAQGEGLSLRVGKDVAVGGVPILLAQYGAVKDSIGAWTMDTDHLVVFNREMKTQFGDAVNGVVGDILGDGSFKTIDAELAGESLTSLTALTFAHNGNFVMYDANGIRLAQTVGTLGSHSALTIAAVDSGFGTPQDVTKAILNQIAAQWKTAGEQLDVSVMGSAMSKVSPGLRDLLKGVGGLEGTNGSITVMHNEVDTLMAHLAGLAPTVGGVIGDGSYKTINSELLGQTLASLTAMKWSLETPHIAKYDATGVRVYNGLTTSMGDKIFSIATIDSGNGSPVDVTKSILSQIAGQWNAAGAGSLALSVSADAVSKASPGLRDLLKGLGGSEMSNGDLVLSKDEVDKLMNHLGALWVSPADILPGAIPGSVAADAISLTKLPVGSVTGTYQGKLTLSGEKYGDGKATLWWGYTDPLHPTMMVYSSMEDYGTQEQTLASALAQVFKDSDITGGTRYTAAYLSSVPGSFKTLLIDSGGKEDVVGDVVMDSAASKSAAAKINAAAQGAAPSPAALPFGPGSIASKGLTTVGVSAPGVAPAAMYIKASSPILVGTTYTRGYNLPGVGHDWLAAQYHYEGVSNVVYTKAEIAAGTTPGQALAAQLGQVHLDTPASATTLTFTYTKQYLDGLPDNSFRNFVATILGSAPTADGGIVVNAHNVDAAIVDASVTGTAHTISAAAPISTDEATIANEALKVAYADGGPDTVDSYGNTVFHEMYGPQGLYKQSDAWLQSSFFTDALGHNIYFEAIVAGTPAQNLAAALGQLHRDASIGGSTATMAVNYTKPYLDAIPGFKDYLIAHGGVQDSMFGVSITPKQVEDALQTAVNGNVASAAAVVHDSLGTKFGFDVFGGGFMGQTVSKSGVQKVKFVASQQGYNTVRGEYKSLKTMNVLMMVNYKGYSQDQAIYDAGKYRLFTNLITTSAADGKAVAFTGVFLDDPTNANIKALVMAFGPTAKKLSSAMGDGYILDAATVSKINVQVLREKMQFIQAAVPKQTVANLSSVGYSVTNKFDKASVDEKIASATVRPLEDGKFDISWSADVPPPTYYSDQTPIHHTLTEHWQMSNEPVVGNQLRLLGVDGDLGPVTWTKPSQTQQAYFAGFAKANELHPEAEIVRLASGSEGMGLVELGAFRDADTKTFYLNKSQKDLYVNAIKTDGGWTKGVDVNPTAGKVYTPPPSYVPPPVAPAAPSMPVHSMPVAPVAAPVPIFVPPPPPPPVVAQGIAAKYGYDKSALDQMEALGFNEDVVSQGKYGPASVTHWKVNGTPVDVKWAYDDQKGATLYHVRSITGGAVADQQLALLAQLRTALPMTLNGDPKIARVLIDHKVASDTTLTGMFTDSGWKETKAYYTLDRTYAQPFADALRDDKAAWSGAAMIPTAVGPAGSSPFMMPPVPKGKTAAPSFIYGFDKTKADSVYGQMVDTDFGKQMTAGGEAESVHQTVFGTTVADWSISPSGKNVGWTKLSFTDPAEAQDASFAMLRKISEEGSQRATGMFVQPNVYDSIPGLRQILLDAGGMEHSYPKLGTVIQLDQGEAAKLLAALNTDSLTGFTLQAASPADYLKYDNLKATGMFDAVPSVGPGGTGWDLGSAHSGQAMFQTVSGKTAWTDLSATLDAQLPLVAATQLQWFAQEGYDSVEVSAQVLQKVPHLAQFLIAAGATVDGSAIRIDSVTMSHLSAFLNKEVLPEMLGGKKLPFSIVDSMGAKVNQTIEGALNEVSGVSGVMTGSVISIAGTDIKSAWTQSASNLYWDSLDKGTASAGQLRSATIAQLRSLLDQMATTGSLERLDISEKVLASSPNLTAILTKYGAVRSKADDGSFYYSFDRVRSNRLLDDINKELGDVIPGVPGYAYQQAILVKWPTAESLTVDKTEAQAAAAFGGPNRKMTFRDAAGNEWLFKPSETGASAAGDAAAYQLALRLGLPIPPVQTYTLNIAAPGMEAKFVSGSLQKMIPGMVGVDVSTLNAIQTQDVMKQSVLDWLIGNTDAGPSKFLITSDNHLWSIDKTGAFDGFKGAFNVLDRTSDGSGGGTPLLFKYFRDAVQDPKKLALIHPNTLSLTLRELQNIPEDEFRRLVAPVAYATKDPRYVGNPEKFISDLLDRKNSAAADFQTFFQRQIKDAMAVNPGDVPKEWSDWLNAGGVFNLDQTPKDLWQADEAALDSVFSAPMTIDGTSFPAGYSPEKERAILNQNVFQPIRSEVSRYYGSGASGHGAGQYGAELIRPRLAKMGLAPIVAQWEDANRWGLLHVLNGERGLSSDSLDRQFRKQWNPDTGTIKFIRSTNRYADAAGRKDNPQAYIDGYNREGIRNLVGGAIGTHVSVAGGGGVWLYADLPYNQAFTSQILGFGNGYESEVLAADLRPDQLIAIRPYSKQIDPADLMNYNGPLF